jgi:hypothetical protein
MTEHDGAGTQRDRDPRQDSDDGTDPLLVRPFIAGGGSAETWPSSAARPPRHARPVHRAVGTPIALPGRPAAPDAASTAGNRRRRALVIAGGGVAAVLALGAAGLAALTSGDGGEDATAPRALPAASPASGAVVPSASRPASRSTAPTAIRRPGGGADPARTATSRPVTRAPGTRASTGDAATGGNGAPASDGRAAAPADRVGVIVGPGGLCLDLNGNVPSDGNFIGVFTCNNTTAQNWTLATDGTLRVDGRCAQSIPGDNTVHIIGCDGRSSARWRAGANGSLTNTATSRCLTDPANGGSKGTAVRLNACTGDANQRWRLP